ncbi:hypothetical protein LXA43DRAFT_1057825 [Ganoderma leucocontextum]|nr:hypothetical protein LXA43DRAFT_1057825 [Ganoderma leucocontextum]
MQLDDLCSMGSIGEAREYVEQSGDSGWRKPGVLGKLLQSRVAEPWLKRSAHQATNVFTRPLPILCTLLAAVLLLSCSTTPRCFRPFKSIKVIQRETFKGQNKCIVAVRHSTITLMSKSSEPRMPVKAHNKAVVKTTRTRQLAMKTCIPMKRPADHERDTCSKAKKRKVTAPDPPAPIPAPRIVPLSKVQEMLQAMEKLTKYTVNIRVVVASLDQVNADVENLLHNTELRIVSNDVANMADDLKSTKQELAKVKELIEHIDAQLEQEWELRHMHQREEQARSKLIADRLQTLIAAFCPPDTKTE